MSGEPRRIPLVPMSLLVDTAAATGAAVGAAAHKLHAPMQRIMTFVDDLSAQALKNRRRVSHRPGPEMAHKLRYHGLVWVPQSEEAWRALCRPVGDTVGGIASLRASALLIPQAWKKRRRKACLAAPCG